jgi:beta-lactam-binding protein with PASTA domain
VAVLVNRAEQETYLMPDLVGMDGSHVADTLRNLGFPVTIVTSRPSAGLPQGAIARHTPVRGRQIRAGEPISIEVTR